MYLECNDDAKSTGASSSAVNAEPSIKIGMTAMPCGPVPFGEDGSNTCITWVSLVVVRTPPTVTKVFSFINGFLIPEGLGQMAQVDISTRRCPDDAEAARYGRRRHAR